MDVQRIGRYQIQEKIGEGGMGEVFRAYDPSIDRVVAVKRLPRTLVVKPESMERFRREARAIASVEHAAIVPIHDYGEDEGQPYIVMRYMPGGSLTDRLSAGRMPLDEVVRILAFLGPGLDFAHERGIIHRDLKPDNILFDAGNSPCIVDFGLARMAQELSALTRTGTLMGTPAYLSPEQARSDAVLDGRCDLYSLGVILFEMLTGRVPFSTTTFAEAVAAHLAAPVPDVLTFNPELPPMCSAIIRKALAKEPHDRFQRAAELVAALQAAQSNRTLVLSPSASPLTDRSVPTPQLTLSTQDLLDKWVREGKKTLDRSHLLAVEEELSDLSINESHFTLLLRSALQLGANLVPWLAKAPGPDTSITTLSSLYEEYPKPDVRVQIVEALAALDGQPADDALLKMVREEDSPRVRTAAALAAARRGKRGEAVKLLVPAMNSGDAAALSAFVALADQYELPEDTPPFSKFDVTLGIARRRWQEHRKTIVAYTLRAGAGGALITAIPGAATPLFTYLAFPDEYFQNIEVIPLSTWILVGVIVGMVLGGVQGLSNGFGLTLADTLWQGESRGTWRALLGALSGLAYSALLISFSALALLEPAAPPAVFVPAQIGFGALKGLTMILVIPRIGFRAPIQRQLIRDSAAVVSIGLLTIAYVYAVYANQAAASLPLNLVTETLYPLGVALAFSTLSSRHSGSQGVEPVWS